MAGEVALTERQRFWLEHIRSCEDAGSRYSVYAAAHDLDIRALYDARARLKSKGVLKDEEPAPRFVRVKQSDGGVVAQFERAAISSSSQT